MAATAQIIWDRKEKVALHGTYADVGTANAALTRYKRSKDSETAAKTYDVVQVSV